MKYQICTTMFGEIIRGKIFDSREEAENAVEELQSIYKLNNMDCVASIEEI